MSDIDNEVVKCSFTGMTLSETMLAFEQKLFVRFFLKNFTESGAKIEITV